MNTTRGISFKRAIEHHLNPRDYAPGFSQEQNMQLYEATKLPFGKWVGRLDFVMWGKSPVLHCFFSVFISNELEYTICELTRYRLSAFKDKKTSCKSYTPRDKIIDFSDGRQCGRLYELKTGLNSKRKPVWFSAIEIIPK